MRYVLLIIGFLCVLASPVMAQQGKWYATLKGGVGIGATSETSSEGFKASSDTELGYVVIGAIGYRLLPTIRVEGEFSWRENNLEEIKFDLGGNSDSVEIDASLRNASLMVNGIYDIPMSDTFRPFVLAGIGASFVKGDVSSASYGGYNVTIGEDDDDTVFAYQAGVGMMYHATDKIAFEVSYRLFGTPEPFDPVSGVEYRNIHHNGLVGIAYSF